MIFWPVLVVTILCYIDARLLDLVHYDTVLETIFEYIALLRRSLPLPDYHYDEVATMAGIRFRFMQKEQPHDYTVRLARNFSEPYPTEQLISGPHLYRGNDHTMVKQLLDSFTPNRARLFLQAKEHREEVVGKDVPWETEKWYGTQYAVRKFEKAMLEKVGPVNPIRYSSDDVSLPSFTRRAVTPS